MFEWCLEEDPAQIYSEKGHKEQFPGEALKGNEFLDVEDEPGERFSYGPPLACNSYLPSLIWQSQIFCPINSDFNLF
jgi:hypothetical protein